MESLINSVTDKDDVELIGSRVGRLNIADQLDSNDDDDTNADDTGTGLFDEPADGDSTDVSDHGEHDHQQDDNYALGGHVTRSGSV